MFFKKALNGGSLAVSVLSHETSFAGETASRVTCKVAIEVQSIWTAVQSKARIVITNFGIKRLDVCSRYVRRIGDQEIESLLLRKEFQSIAMNQLDAASEVVVIYIPLGDFQCLGGDINADSLSVSCLVDD